MTILDKRRSIQRSQRHNVSLWWLIQETHKGSWHQRSISYTCEITRPYGDGLAELLRNRVGESRLTMDVFSEVYKSISNSGVENVYEVESNSFKVFGHQCPVYDGLRDAGLGHDLIMRMCTGASTLIFDALKRHYPIIDAGIVFRDKPDGYCIEWYKLK